MSPEPIMGVIVPVFRHSGLVAEALTSLKNQEGAPGFVVVAVNDGCPYKETDLACLSFSQEGSGPPLHYIKRRNGGLSAARNTGLEFLLATYPSLQAVYFLDADNRLRSYALARMARALAEHPDADWFYPDLEMFGLALVAQYRGEYSGLIHTADNISEAGSLVRRGVLDAGLRFDENMRHGYEDWDFWLGAREKGFLGRHLPDMGFSYRKRPESMLAESQRDDAEIRSYIRRKRRATFQVRALLELESSEAPRYAIVLDGNSVVLALDPCRPTEIISVEDFVRRFWRWFLRPDTHFASPFIVCLSRQAYQIVQDTGIANWVFWDLEARLRNSHMSTTKLEHWSQSGLQVDRDGLAPADIGLKTHIVMITLDFARDVCADQGGREWWGTVMIGGSKASASTRAVRVDDGRVENLPARRAMMGAFQIINELHDSEYRRAGEIEWKWANSGVPDRHTAYKAVRALANNGVVFPVKPDSRRHVGLLLSFSDFGGVEKVAFNTARVLRDAGFVPHLVLFRTGDVRLPPQFRDVFESFLWVTSDNLLRWDGDEYNGTRLSWWSQNGDRTDVVGMLAWFDAVLNCQSADAHGVMGELKRRGVLTLTHQHLVERSPAGRPGGSAVLAKAFEHSYAAILTASRLLTSWFVANGVPHEKLFSVDNAPSYAISAAVQDEILRERSSRSSANMPLRVLFAARFDVQKGLDRLVQLIQNTAAFNLEWRVVGKAVVDADELVERLDTLVAVEPPAYTEEELTRLYGWADVVVLPSRYEGVPLTAIEAMRCGAIMLASDSGGISEIIRNGVDGYIVPQETCVADMTARLRELSDNRALCRSVSVAASEAGRERSWSKSLREVISFLNRRIPPVPAPMAEAS